MKYNLDILRQIHYSKLSPYQWEFLRNEGIVNGYGNKGNVFLQKLLKIIGPEFKEANSAFHDVRYWQGGTEYDRWRADWGFYKALVRDSFKSSNIPYYFILSLVYFLGVRILGWQYFIYK